MTDAISLTDYQKNVLTETVLGEAEGEGDVGQIAVLNVIKNRATSGLYSSDPAQVALQHAQFSAWPFPGNKGNPLVYTPSTSPYYQRAAALVDQVFGGDTEDNTGGALNYHTLAVDPGWAHMTQTAVIGHHVFYTPVGYQSQNVPIQGAGSSIDLAGMMSDAEAYLGGTPSVPTGNIALDAITQNLLTPVATSGGITKTPVPLAPLNPQIGQVTAVGNISNSSAIRAAGQGDVTLALNWATPAVNFFDPLDEIDQNFIKGQNNTDSWLNLLSSNPAAAHANPIPLMVNSGPNGGMQELHDLLNAGMGSNINPSQNHITASDTGGGTLLQANTPVYGSNQSYAGEPNYMDEGSVSESDLGLATQQYVTKQVVTWAPPPATKPMNSSGSPDDRDSGDYSWITLDSPDFDSSMTNIAQPAPGLVRTVKTIKVPVAAPKTAAPKTAYEIWAESTGQAAAPASQPKSIFERIFDGLFGGASQGDTSGMPIISAEGFNLTGLLSGLNFGGSSGGDASSGGGLFGGVSLSTHVINPATPVGALVAKGMTAAQAYNTINANENTGFSSDMDKNPDNNFGNPVGGSSGGAPYLGTFKG